MSKDTPSVIEIINGWYSRPEVKEALTRIYLEDRPILKKKTKKVKKNRNAKQQTIKTFQFTQI